jgi:tetratricopeptide (TPR) repeat protein
MTTVLSPLQAFPETLCDVCGLPRPACGCAAMATRLRESGDSTLQHAIREVRLGRLHSARKWLHLAANMDPENASVWAVSGCCAFVIGDVAMAQAGWRRSLEIDASSAAGDWIASLESGSISDGLAHFNTALRVAAEEQFESAGSEIASALALVPDFGPAMRLAGLIESARGDDRSALRHWREYLSLVGDDEDVLRWITSTPRIRSPDAPSAWRSSFRALAFAAGIAVAVIAGALVRDKYPKRTSTPPHPVARSPQRIAASVGPLFAPSVQGRSRSHIGLSAYHEGRIAFQSQNWREAVASLQLATDFDNDGKNHEVRENALYLLAIAHSRLGDTLAARCLRILLLARLPRRGTFPHSHDSIFSSGRD